MADILGIVSYGSVRAAIGVDAEEFSDEAIAALELGDSLLSDLNDWLPATPSIEDLITGGAASTGLAVNSDRLKFLALQGYCRFFCALELMGSAENWRLTQLTDGVVASRRSDRVNLDKVVDRLKQMQDVYRDRLLSLLGESSSLDARPTFAGKATPTTDPVTNS